MLPISAIIVAKDNPPHLFETLDSIVDLVSQTVIIDIGIAEETKHKLEKLKQFSNVTVVPINKPVPYVELIREESKKYADHDYILLLDPDEVVQPQLKQYIEENYQTHDYIAIPRKNMIFGKWIEYSRWWPDFQIRFFKKENVTWPVELHAQPTTIGDGITLEAQEDLALIHYNYHTLDEYISKMIRYAKSEAQSAVETKTKITIPKTIKKALSEFISRYFAHEGYKDGMHGFMLAFLQMVYYFLVYGYWWEMKGYPNDEADKVMQESQTFFKQGFTESTHWIRSIHKKSLPVKETLLYYITKLLR